MITHTLSVAYTEVSGPDNLSDQDKDLLQLAWEACDSAYAPYSNFHVGASVRLANDLVFKGNNQENAAYPSGICAERVAVFSASALHPGIPIRSIAVVARTEVFNLSVPVTPCGACRQVIAEYEMLSGQPIRILLQGNSEKIWIIDGIANLLPLMFHGGELKK
ncbi:MAG: cytidine deaminase [Bacteroidota bacterium]